MLMKEIEKLMNSVGSSSDYRVVNLGGKKLYIEGIKSVVSFGETEMSFNLKKKYLKVQGTNLQTNYLDKTTCVITGDISSVVVQ